MAGRLLVFDLERNSIRTVKLRQARPDCKTCSRVNRITPQDVKKTDYVDFCDASFQNVVSETLSAVTHGCERQTRSHFSHLVDPFSHDRRSCRNPKLVFQFRLVFC